MGAMFAEKPSARHRVISEMRPDMVKAALRKPESVDFQADIGSCLDYARREAGWTLEELAAHLSPAPGSDKRDPRQVQRWIEGKERVQVDVVFTVPALRKPFVIALAKLSGEFQIEATLRCVA